MLWKAPYLLHRISEWKEGLFFFLRVKHLLLACRSLSSELQKKKSSNEIRHRLIVLKGKKKKKVNISITEEYTHKKNCSSSGIILKLWSNSSGEACCRVMHSRQPVGRPSETRNSDELNHTTKIVMYNRFL